MKRALLILLVFAGVALYASERGMTTAEISCEGATVLQAPLTQAPVNPHFNTLTRDDYSPNVNADFTAMIPSRSQFGIFYRDFDHNTQIYSSLGAAFSLATWAVEKAPLWMRPELQNTLWGLSFAKQNIYANLILAAQDPIIDELAFSIAHSSHEYLESDFASPQLFLDNANFIYSIDQDLDYVTVVDYGNSSSDPNYYSTTRYKRKNADGIIEEIEVPRDIYYWYIVHPKLSDEIPAFIDPAIVENNSTHNNNIAAPPLGVFWRSWLYNVAEGDYPALSDTLQQCSTLFNRNTEANDAIHAIQWWINHTMGFTSNNERPHQPVRIYRKHIGRCGEYQDYTNAAARLALIPCTNINSVSTDHVWNEFWETDWVHWEPVNGYINSPLVYENGWGKVFGSVFETRSDGYFSPVTDRYSEGIATINIRVVDQNEAPVDGARIILAIFETSPRLDTVGFTGNDGWVSFTVGEGRDFRARCETPWAVYPAIAGTYAALTSASVDGETYNYLFTIPAVMPAPQFTTISPPTDPIEDYDVSIEYNCPAYYLSGKVTWDDISSLGISPYFYKYVPVPSTVSAFTVNSDDLLFLQIDMMASVWDNPLPMNSGQIDFSIPIGMNWYTVLDNSFASGNAVLAAGRLITHANVSIDDENIPSPNVSDIKAWPNPFSHSLKISLNGIKSYAKLDIFNHRGQLVRSLALDKQIDNDYNLIWDGKDRAANTCATGIYYLKVTDVKSKLFKRVLLIR